MSTLNTMGPRVRRAAVLACIAFLAIVVSPVASAQYVQRYSTITNGAVTFTGNTLGLNKSNGTNAPGTQGSIGTFITTNTALQDAAAWPVGTTADWTQNSSTAVLSLPAGATVLYAELIWSGSYSYGGENVQAFINNAVTFTTPSGTTSVSPDPATTRTLGTPDGSGGCNAGAPCFYVRSANVTSLVSSAGGGTYVVGGVPATQGSSDNNSNVAGWTLAVAYRSGALPSRNLNIFVGSELTNGSVTTTANLSGFCTPSSGTVSARLLASALEGDPQITGDQMQIGPTVGTLGTINGSRNPTSNFFASQITDDTGALDTRGSFGGSNSTPGAGTSGARQGYDITSVDASARFINGQTSAVVRGTSSGDQYVINALGVQVNVGAPNFPVTVKAVDKAVAQVGDALNYTVRLDNRTGTAAATNVVFRDAVPPGTSFIANSLSIDGVASPGADPAAGVNVGTINAGAQKTIRFGVRVNAIPAAPAAAVYDNAARWDYQFVSCAGQPVSNGTVTTNAVQTRIARLAPVKTVTPAGAVTGGTVLTYTITVPNDGTAPSSGTTLQDSIPAGTTYVAGSTRLNGAVVADVGGTMPFALATRIASPGEPAGRINDGETATVVFQVRVDAGFSGDIVNSAIVDVDGSGAAPAQTAQVVSSGLNPASLTIAKAAVGAFVRGANGTFTLTVANGAGAGPTSGLVTVSDTLPAGLSLAAVPNGAGWSCTGAGNGFSCTRSSALAAGATYPPITVNVRVGQDAPASVTNTAQVAGGGDPTPSTGAATVAVTANADLGIAKIASNLNPSIGANVTFTLTATNAGPSDATGVAVSDALPAGLTFVSATPSQGGYDSGSGAWTLDTLSSGGSATLTLVAQFTGPGQPTNTASIAGNETDPDPTDNTAAVTLPTQVADLSLAKAVDNVAPPVGGAVAFTLTLRNSGPSAATGIAVTDLLPTGLTFVSASASSGSYASGSGVWSVPNLAAGASATLTLDATVSGSAVVTNTAEITAADQFDPNSTPGNGAASENDRASVTLTPQGADLAVAKSVDRANPDIGDNITFTLRVDNLGPANATVVVVDDVLPAGLAFVSATASQGSYASGSGRWSVGNVARGATATLTLVATFNGPGQVTNSATVSSAVSDPNLANNTSTLVVPSQIADLSLSKSVSSATPSLGADVTFTLVAANSGPNAANNVRIADLLPSGLAFVSATASQGSYANGTGQWTVGTIAAGGGATLQLVARVTSSDGITNTAQVAASDQFDPNSTPNNNDPGEDDQASVVLAPLAADLAVSKSAAPANPNAGDLVTFTVNVTNPGPGAAIDARVADPVPAGATFQSASATIGSYDAGSGVWTLGNLAPGATASLTLRAVYNGPGQVTNTASASSSTPDPDPLDNTASATVPAQVADVSIAKTLTGGSAFGDNTSFRVTLANAGPNTATNVTVTDRLPAGLEFVSFGATAGSYASGSGTWFVPSLAAGQQATLDLVARIATTQPLTNAAELTAVDQADPDSLPGNADPNEDDLASVALVPASADLAMAKSVNLPNPNVGQNVVFTLTVTNTGPSTAANVVVADPLPTGLVFVAASGAVNPSSYTAAGNWSIGSLAPGASATLLVTATFNGPGQVNNVATVGSTTPDPNLANNTGSVRIPSQIADLSVGKTADTTTPDVGGNVRFTITARNAGPNTATGVVLGDLLPAGLAAGTALATQGGYNPATGAWTLGSLSAGAQATLTLDARVDSAQAITNTVQVVASDQYDPNSTPNNNNPGENDQASVTLTPASADLSIAKGVDQPNPAVGANVVFTLSATNAGPSEATDVTVSDPLPAGLTFLAANPSQGSYDAGTGRWLVGALASGGNARLALTARYDGPGQVINLATISAPLPDPDPLGNTARVSVPSQVADLAVALAADQLAPDVGAPVTFTVTLTNAGPDAASNARVAIPLPPGTTFASLGASDGQYNAATGIWTPGPLANGATATLRLVVTVTAPGAIEATAEVVASDQFDPDSTPNNVADAEDDRATVTLTPQSADLAVAKSVDTPSPNRGDVVSYIVTARNAGPSNASGVVIADVLPAGFVLQLATPSQGNFDAGGGLWTLGTVPNGATATLTLRGVYDATGQITNTASVVAADQPDPNPANNTGSITIPSQVADVAIAKTVDVPAPAVGGEARFTITATNAGPNSATGLVVSDALPAGLVFVSADATQGAYNAASGLWTTGTLPAGQSAALAIVATVAGSSAVTNTAQVVAVDQFDPNSVPNNSQPGENDQASVTLAPQSADLSIAKGVDNPAPNSGDNVSYRLTVTNAGPSAAAAVVVDDPVPAGATFVSATPSVGSYDSGSGVWTVGSLAAGAPPAVLDLVVTYQGPGDVINTATVSAATPDPNLAGNTASVTVPAQVTDLSLAKTVSAATTRIGDILTYTLTVANDGPNAATTLRVIDPLPAGVAFQSSTPSQGAFDAASGVWSVGTLAAGAQATLAIAVEVTGAGSLVNVAEILSVDQFDPDSTPNNRAAGEDDYATATATAGGGSLGGSVFIDLDGDGSRDPGERGVAGATIVLTGNDVNGNAVNRSVVTDADGLYQFTDLAAAGPGGYTLTQVQPGGFQSSGAAVGNLGGVAGTDDIRQIPLGAGGVGTGYDFGEQGSSVSGSAWFDDATDRRRAGDERGIEGIVVELVDPATGTVVATATTDADGRYTLSGLTPGNYVLRFRDPTSNAVLGVPVNGEAGNPAGGSTLAADRGGLNLSIGPGEVKQEQGLAFAPTGIVYDSVSREPLAGATVTFCGPPGFVPATGLVGGASYTLDPARSNCARQDVGATGAYQFLLTPAAPVGDYTIEVTGPAGYQLSALLPPEPGPFAPPASSAPYAVQTQAAPPDVSAATLYYQHFTLGGGAADIVHNHIPLDSLTPTEILLTKTAGAPEVELGDSLAYEIRVQSVSGVGLATLLVEDRLPAGFRYIPGTARIQRNGRAAAAQPDPAGGVGPILTFTVARGASGEPALPSGGTVVLTYRVRVGVGAQQGDGINRARARSGVVQSNEGRAKVKVTGGVFTSEACIVGKIWLDCDDDAMQDDGEVGVPGVRVYLEDGTYLIGDSEGQYSLCGLTPTTHVLRIDPTTLPAGATPAVIDNRNAGAADSRFLDLKNGELHRADFRIGSCGETVNEAVRQRRGETKAPPGASTPPPPDTPARVLRSDRCRESVDRRDCREGGAP